MRTLLVAVLFTIGVVGQTAATTAIPGGSYQNTCTQITLQNLLGGPGQNLIAQCPKKNGTMIAARLALPCSGDIQNKNGVLTCVAGPNPFAPPPGSYQAKCTNVSVAGPILRGSCKTAIGIRVQTTLNVLSCGDSDISVNVAGQLTC